MQGMIRIYLLHNNTLYRGGRYYGIQRPVLCCTCYFYLYHWVAHSNLFLSNGCIFYYVSFTGLHILFCLYHKVAHFILFYTGLHILFCFLTGLHILFCFLTGLHILFYLITSLHILFCYITGLHIFFLYHCVAFISGLHI